MNSKVLNQIIPGTLHSRYSIDDCQCDDEEEMLNFPLEFLNSVTPSGMALHKLDIKVGAIAMLLRNINMSEVMCNVTRAIIRNIYQDIIDVEIVSGNGKRNCFPKSTIQKYILEKHIGQRVFLPRIDLYTKSLDLPFLLKRR